MARLPSASRSLAIIVALVLAGVAVFFIWRYVNDVEEQVRQDQELVEVYVATRSIPEGTRADAAISQGLIQRDEIPRVNRPENAITALEQIDGLAAVDPIIAGEVILQARFGDPTSQAVEFEIPEGLQAISVQVGVPAGVAGFVRPGDRISVIAHIAAAPPTAPVIGPDGNPVEVEGDGPSETRSQFLVQDVQVLSLGRRVLVQTEQGEQDSVQQTESVLATIAVTDEQAEQLVFAINEGEGDNSLYFTLLPDGYEADDTPGRTFENLFTPSAS